MDVEVNNIGLPHPPSQRHILTDVTANDPIGWFPFTGKTDLNLAVLRVDFQGPSSSKKQGAEPFQRMALQQTHGYSCQSKRALASQSVAPTRPVWEWVGVNPSWTNPGWLIGLIWAPRHSPNVIVIFATQMVAPHFNSSAVSGGDQQTFWQGAVWVASDVEIRGGRAHPRRLRIDWKQI